MMTVKNPFTGRYEDVNPVHFQKRGFIYKHEDGYYGYAVDGVIYTQRVGYSELLLSLLIKFKPEPEDHKARYLVGQYFNAFRDGKVLECVRLSNEIRSLR